MQSNMYALDSFPNIKTVSNTKTDWDIDDRLIVADEDEDDTYYSGTVVEVFDDSIRVQFDDDPDGEFEVDLPVDSPRILGQMFGGSAEEKIAEPMTENEAREWTYDADDADDDGLEPEEDENEDGGDEWEWERGDRIVVRIDKKYYFGTVLGTQWVRSKTDMTLENQKLTVTLDIDNDPTKTNIWYSNSIDVVGRTDTQKKNPEPYSRNAIVPFISEWKSNTDADFYRELDRTIDPYTIDWKIGDRIIVQKSVSKHYLGTVLKVDDDNIVVRYDYDETGKSEETLPRRHSKSVNEGIVGRSHYKEKHPEPITFLTEVQELIESEDEDTQEPESMPDSDDDVYKEKWLRWKKGDRIVIRLFGNYKIGSVLKTEPVDSNRDSGNYLDILLDEHKGSPDEVFTWEDEDPNIVGRTSTQSSMPEDMSWEEIRPLIDEWGVSYEYQLGLHKKDVGESPSEEPQVDIEPEPEIEPESEGPLTTYKGWNVGDRVISRGANDNKYYLGTVRSFVTSDYNTTMHYVLDDGTQDYESFPLHRVLGRSTHQEPHARAMYRKRAERMLSPPHMQPGAEDQKPERTEPTTSEPRTVPDPPVPDIQPETLPDVPTDIPKAPTVTTGNNWQIGNRALLSVGNKYYLATVTDISGNNIEFQYDDGEVETLPKNSENIVGRTSESTPNPKGMYRKRALPLLDPKHTQPPKSVTLAPIVPQKVPPKPAPTPVVPEELPATPPTAPTPPPVMEDGWNEGDRVVVDVLKGKYAVGTIVKTYKTKIRIKYDDGSSEDIKRKDIDSIILGKTLSQERRPKKIGRREAELLVRQVTPGRAPEPEIVPEIPAPAAPTTPAPITPTIEEEDLEDLNIEPVTESEYSMDLNISVISDRIAVSAWSFDTTDEEEEVDTTILERFGFRDVGPFAYAEIPNKTAMRSLFKKLNELQDSGKIFVPPIYWKDFALAHSTLMQSESKAQFAQELTQLDLRNLYLVEMRKHQNRNAVNIGIVVEDGKIYAVVFYGKNIRGKWFVQRRVQSIQWVRQDEGAHFAFFRKKSEVRNFVNDIASKIQIDNMADVEEQISGIRIQK